jgi:hypothetical protein
MDDLVACHFNNNGQFTVRSAYKVFMADKKKSTERRGGGSASGTASRLDDLFWRRVWNLNCPKKMIHFLWRLGHNSLALRVNLRRRGMKIDTSCVMCGRLDEDGAHLFFKCKGVRHVWATPQRRSLSKALTQLQLTEGKKGISVTAGGDGGLFRLRWPAGRREVAETAGLSPAGGVVCSLGPSLSRFRFPGDASEAVAAASWRNKSSRILPHPIGAPLWQRWQVRGGGAPCVEFLCRSPWSAATLLGACRGEVGSGLLFPGWRGSSGFRGDVEVDGELGFKAESAWGVSPADGRSR